MKLVSVKVDSFKRVRSAELQLANINILVGSNGSGKSSIIQAIHLAACLLRQVDRVSHDKTSTVSAGALDYLPTEDYKSLGHNSDWGNGAGTSSSKVSFTFESDNSNPRADCTIRSARNAGLSIQGFVPPDLLPLLRTKKSFFSGYIPGISGIPNREEKKSRKVVLRSCSYGDSNVILRNVLLLLSEVPGNIALIEGWISEIIGAIRIRVTHNDDADLFIKCEVEIGGTSKPIELMGTGYIQLIQIFSYILLFKPGVLLIDEPDIHLHPSVQEKLVQVLARVASERDLRVLMTTHSPFVVRGAPQSANVYWMHDGAIEAGDRKTVELALGWGAFGKKVILISEDTNLEYLRFLLAQWPEVEQFVTLCPGRGYKSLVTPAQGREIAEALGNKFKILVHRDRDSLTPDEVAALQAAYARERVTVWCPDYSDIEASFCSASFISRLLGCDEPTAQGYIEQVLTRNQVAIREQFDSQRRAANDEFHKGGGSPTNNDVWAQLQSHVLRGAKGKFVMKQLMSTVPGSRYSEKSILASPIGPPLALSLKHAIEHLLG